MDEDQEFTLAEARRLGKLLAAIDFKLNFWKMQRDQFNQMIVLLESAKQKAIDEQKEILLDQFNRKEA